MDANHEANGGLQLGSGDGQCVSACALSLPAVHLVAGPLFDIILASELLRSLQRDVLSSHNSSALDLFLHSICSFLLKLIKSSSPLQESFRNKRGSVRVKRHDENFEMESLK